MIVVIHGCLQSAESMALGSGWNQIAEKNNLVVFYPQAPEGSNPVGCWNWFLPENQRADSGQLKNIMDEIASLKKMLQIEKAPLYATGISSGAATVAGLLACYPHDFSAAALHSGPSYGLAQSYLEGEKILKEGPPDTKATSSFCHPRDFSGSLLVIQGSADKVVNPKNAQRIMTDFIGTSSSATAKPMPEENGLKFSTSFYERGSTRGQLVMIEGLPHAWSGFAGNLKYAQFVGPGRPFGPTQIPFFSEQGPSATNMIWDFFDSSSRKPSSTKSAPLLRKKARSQK